MGARLRHIGRKYGAHLADLSGTDQLVVNAKDVVPRCLDHQVRRSLFLDPEPPAWCAERGKWTSSSVAIVAGWKFGGP